MPPGTFTWREGRSGLGLPERDVAEPYFRVESGGDGSISSLPIVSNDKPQTNEKKEKDAAKEMEVRKAIIPLDERMTMFTNLLKEKEVSGLINFFSPRMPLTSRITETAKEF